MGDGNLGSANLLPAKEAADRLDRGEPIVEV
jgi:hypothetical protein